MRVSKKHLSILYSTHVYHRPKPRLLAYVAFTFTEHDACCNFEARSDKNKPIEKLMPSTLFRQEAVRLSMCLPRAGVVVNRSNDASRDVRMCMCNGTTWASSHLN